MNICQAPLEYSFSQSAMALLPRYLFGLAGIFGWGLLLELLCRGRFRNHSYLHAYLEGTVMVSLLMLAASCLGYHNQALAVAVPGVLLGMAAIVIDWKRLRKEAASASPLRVWEAAVLLVLACPLLIFLSLEYIQYNDLAYVWAYRGKALTCEPLFGADYVKEKFWAGTHPEYPLYLPLLFSYFFSLADSFRDDFVKLWESVSAFALLFLVFIDTKELFRKQRDAGMIPWTASIPVLAILFWGAADGRIEFNCAVFMTLVTLALLREDWWRLPLYLFALGFCKNESLVAAHLFVALHIGFMLVRRAAGRSVASREWAYLIPWALLDIAWLMVATRLPNNHEQYASRILSVSVWKEGASRIPLVLTNFMGTLSQWPWITFALLIPVLLILFRKRVREASRGYAYQLIVLWHGGMLLAYLAIFIVTPWNLAVMFHALPRLILPFYPVAIIGLIGLAFDDECAGITAWPVVSRCLMVLLICFHLLPTLRHGYEYVGGLPFRIKNEALGGSYYLTDPLLREVLYLDKQLPLAGRGAMLDYYWYFDVNYLFYPRKFYSAAPDTVALTWRPYEPWAAVSLEEQQRWGFQFVIDVPEPVSSRIKDLSGNLWD